MANETLFEFEQTFSRTDVAAYLREIADKLDADGTLGFTAGGQKTTDVSVPDRLQFEVNVERDPNNDGSADMEIEFELEWREGDDDSAQGTLEIG